jgi:histidine triad (HIT) family protein
MSLYGTYDPDNVFGRILRGELPCAKVFEDEHVLVIMDAFPQSRGHCLVIPKTPARNLLEIDEAALAKATVAVRRVARAVEAALKPDGLVITQFNGSAAGQTVFHLHFHVIPRWDGDALKPHAGARAEPADLQALAAQIAARL